VSDVLERAAGYCEVGGLPLHRNDVVLHHRKNRGKGGKGNLDTAENIVAIHGGCHVSIHANPDRSYTLGHLVHTNEDPAKIPVRLLPGLCAVR